MKRVIICIILVAVTLILACGCYFYSQSVTESVGRKLADIRTSYESGDRDRARVLSDEVSGEWLRYCSCHIFITDSAAVSEITSAITKMSAMIKNGDDGYVNECAAAITLTEMYRRNQSPMLCNIF